MRGIQQTMMDCDVTTHQVPVVQVRICLSGELMTAIPMRLLTGDERHRPERNITVFGLKLADPAVGWCQNSLNSNARWTGSYSNRP